MIEELHRFVLAAENGNVTKTAEKIFITQSALSQSIKRLEKALGTKLFFQKGKTLQLTPDGISIHQIGKKILELWEKAQNATSRQIATPFYAIGLFDNAALYLAKYFQKTTLLGKIQLELTIEMTGKLIPQLQLGIFDLVICVVNQKYPDVPNTLLLETFHEKLIPVSAKKFTDSLENIPFIVYNKGSFTRDQIDSVFIKAGVNPKIFAESTSVTFMKELALLGCGVTLLPENLVKVELKQGLLKKQKLPLQWKRTYGIYAHKKGRIQKDHFLIKEITAYLTKQKQ